MAGRGRPKAPAIIAWLAAHPRFQLRYTPHLLLLAQPGRATREPLEYSGAHRKGFNGRRRCTRCVEVEKAQQHNVKRGCQLLEVSRSAYYAHRAGPSRHAEEAAELTWRIIAVHNDSGGSYGAPRVHAELRGSGRRHSRKRIARLMRAAGRRGRVLKRWRTTTIPDPPAVAVRPDLVGRGFRVAPEQVNTRWCGDITYINTWDGWLYLATIIDLASRRVVGWAVADNLRADLVAKALSRAVAARRPAASVIFHAVGAVSTPVGSTPGWLTTSVCVCQSAVRASVGQRRRRIILCRDQGRVAGPAGVADPDRRRESHLGMD